MAVATVGWGTYIWGGSYYYLIVIFTSSDVIIKHYQMSYLLITSTIYAQLVTITPLQTPKSYSSNLRNASCMSSCTLAKCAFTPSSPSTL